MTGLLGLHAWESPSPMDSALIKTFNEEELFSDGIHPNKQGAELMAKILYPVIDLACRSVFIV